MKLQISPEQCIKIAAISKQTNNNNNFELKVKKMTRYRD